MYCHKCGQQAVEDAIFCQHCGVSLLPPERPKLAAHSPILPETVIPYATPSASLSTPSNSGTVPTVGPRPWAADRPALKNWLLIHLATWLGGATLWISATNGTALATVGSVCFFSSIIPYVVSLVYAYRVQDKLYAAKLYKHGAWHVVVGGLLLNPFGLGFVITASVLNTVRKIDRDLDRTA